MGYECGIVDLASFLTSGLCPAVDYYKTVVLHKQLADKLKVLNIIKFLHHYIKTNDTVSN